MVTERIRAYYQQNKEAAFKKKEMPHLLPAHILFYRDGVGESQYGMVKDEELIQIRKAVANAKAGAQVDNVPKKVLDFASAWDPKITLIVVGKRHHARFFPNPAGEKNLNAGSCIDDKVTAPNQFNFYLQSHESPIGTARTGHYVVIVNECGYTPKELQETVGLPFGTTYRTEANNLHQTNRLCFTGSRATTALSICAPARYADILCTRLRCYMKPVLDGEIRDHLYNAPVGDYRRPKLIWGSKGNPWKAEVADTMFYL